MLKTETENEVKFNNSYQALYRQLKDVYAKVGATDFFGVVGEKFVYSRHEKVRVCVSRVTTCAGRAFRVRFFFVARRFFSAGRVRLPQMRHTMGDAKECYCGT